MIIEKRNLEKNGVLINIYFFCRALGIQKPESAENPTSFMETYVSENHLSWNDITDKVRILRENYKSRRRNNHRKKTESLRSETQQFFSENAGTKSKNRTCLRCDTSFFSRFGNRMCDKCNYLINNFIGEDGIA